MLSAAQIIYLICLPVPTVFLIILKALKCLEIKPYFLGFGTCLGICLLAVISAVILYPFGLLSIVLLPLILLCFMYQIYRHELYTPADAVSFYLGISQFAQCICVGISIISIAELKVMIDEHSPDVCACYYEKIRDFGSAEEYIAAALIRTAVVCAAAFLIHKINLSKKMSDFKRAACSALISALICVPTENLAMIIF